MAITPKESRHLPHTVGHGLDARGRETQAVDQRRADAVALRVIDVLTIGLLDRIKTCRDAGGHAPEDRLLGARGEGGSASCRGAGPLTHLSDFLLDLHRSVEESGRGSRSPPPAGAASAYGES
jgi:hypothetical protein